MLSICLNLSNGFGIRFIVYSLKKKEKKTIVSCKTPCTPLAITFLQQPYCTPSLQHVNNELFASFYVHVITAKTSMFLMK